MKVTITTEAGKSIEVELTEEQSKDLGLVEKKPRTGYERVGKNGAYYVDDCCGEINNETELCLDIDDDCYNAANYYNDYPLAKANARADRLMRQLRRYAAEHGRIPSSDDWHNHSNMKVAIGYDYKNNKLFIDADRDMRQFGNVYFRSILDCQNAIKQFKEELLWYFTEYQPMHYDQTQGE